MKFKKILLSLGTLTAIAGPVIALSSCADKGILKIKGTKLFSGSGPFGSVTAISTIGSSISDSLRLEFQKSSPIIDGFWNKIPSPEYDLFKKRFTDARIGKKNRDIPWYEIWTLTAEFEKTISDEINASLISKKDTNISEIKIDKNNSSSVSPSTINVIDSPIKTMPGYIKKQNINNLVKDKNPDSSRISSSVVASASSSHINAITQAEYEALNEEKVNNFITTTLDVSYFFGPCSFQKDAPYIKVIKPTPTIPLYKVTVTLKDAIVIKVIPNTDHSKPNQIPWVFIAFKGTSENVFSPEIITPGSLKVEKFDDTNLPSEDYLGYKFN